MSVLWVQLVTIYGQNGHFWGRKVVKNDQKMTNFQSVPNRSGMVPNGEKRSKTMEKRGFWRFLDLFGLFLAHVAVCCSSVENRVRMPERVCRCRLGPRECVRSIGNARKQSVEGVVVFFIRLGVRDMTLESFLGGRIPAPPPAAGILGGNFRKFWSILGKNSLNQK